MLRRSSMGLYSASSSNTASTPPSLALASASVTASPSLTPRYDRRGRTSATSSSSPVPPVASRNRPIRPSTWQDRKYPAVSHVYDGLPSSPLSPLPLTPRLSDMSWTSSRSVPLRDMM